ncbi:hypothetical protein FGO68_gene9742 [Halteria grandinella]|uniref:C2 domain-containing protein n=1 Tax=Halteria grandinella TaxID=5974 RepID=A0A8J8SZB2_HALGN|nr:hypothetical protein FGO68_gene9742 [Halteria grandinella]
MQYPQPYLSLKIVKAKLYRNTDFLTGMDPYVKIEHSGQVWKTTVKGQAGRFPIWNETFEVPIQDVKDYLVKLSVYDSDFFKKDDFIGSVMLNVERLLIQQNVPSKEWFDIFYKGQVSGEILVESSYHTPSVMVQNPEQLKLNIQAPPKIVQLAEHNLLPTNENTLGAGSAQILLSGDTQKIYCPLSTLANNPSGYAVGTTVSGKQIGTPMYQ